MLPAEAPCKFSENRCSTDQLCYKCILGVRWGWNWHDIGCQKGVLRGFLGGSWGVLGAFFRGAAAHRGSERAPWRCLSPPGAALGRVWGLRKPSWILFAASRSPAGTFLGTSGSRFGTFLAPPKALQIAVASTDTDTNRHDQEICHARRKKGSAEWAKPS